MDTVFAGFTRETFDFLSDLKGNNTKKWFDANRERYDRYWKAPAFDLTTALADSMSVLSPPLKAEARVNGTVRRINRDVRFSRDKTPYNPRIHFVFWTGSHPNRSPAFHLVLHPDGIGYGAGVFGLDGKSLTKIRDRIVALEDRSKLLSAIEQAKSIGCTFDKPDLKRTPQGYSADADWEHLLRHKAFVLRTIEDIEIPDWIYQPGCCEKIIELVNDLQPLITWLHDGNGILSGDIKLPPA